MKILITGQNSYAGTQFAARVAHLKKNWIVNFITVRNDEWKKEDFSIYDAVYHVAGVVHIKEKKENENLYYQVNRDLTYQLAVKAKNEGVKSFVFLSSMAVYGLIGKIGEDTIISKNTKESPTSFYGKSKLEAEKLLLTLQTKNFDVSILRIPMIYGNGCPGNYSLLSNLTKKSPVFPKIKNKRSLVFIDHLSDIVVHIIEKEISGVFLVKNPTGIDTNEMVNEIAKNHDKKIYNSVLLGLMIKLFGNQFTVFRKMFSNVFYKNEDCIITGFEFNPLSFEESIALSEGKELGDNH